jgi:hypothetical protein
MLYLWQQFKHTSASSDTAFMQFKTPFWVMSCSSEWCSISQKTKCACYCLKEQHLKLKPCPYLTDLHILGRFIYFYTYFKPVQTFFINYSKFLFSFKNKYVFYEEIVSLGSMMLNLALQVNTHLEYCWWLVKVANNT